MPSYGAAQEVSARTGEQFDSGGATIVSRIACQVREGRIAVMAKGRRGKGADVLNATPLLTLQGMLSNELVKELDQLTDEKDALRPRCSTASSCCKIARSSSRETSAR